jgi:hypothetical protein
MPSRPGQTYEMKAEEWEIIHLNVCSIGQLLIPESRPLLWVRPHFLSNNSEKKIRRRGTQQKSDDCLLVKIDNSDDLSVVGSWSGDMRANRFPL